MYRDQVHQALNMSNSDADDVLESDSFPDGKEDSINDEALASVSSIDGEDAEEDLEPVDQYTPTQSWQATGMWLSDYTGYTETLEEAQQVMLEYEISTGSKFVICYKRANFGKTFLDIQQAKHKVTWDVRSNPDKGSSTACGNVIIPFDGVPFIFAGKKAFECRHGHDRGVAARLKWKKIAVEKQKLDPNFKLRAPRIQPSMKLGCKAQMHMTHVIRFPHYEITKDSQYWRRTMSDKLRVAIHKTPLKLQPVDRFFLTLCDPSKHNHVLKDAKLMRKAHTLRLQSQGSHKKARRKRRSVPDEMSVIEKELQLMKGGEISTNVSNHVDITTSDIPISTNTNIPTTSPSNTLRATRCAKVLEKLINATFMVENADKLAELEQKANDLLKDAKTSINNDDNATKTKCDDIDASNDDDDNVVVVPFPIVGNPSLVAGTVQTDNTTTEEGCRKGLKRKANNEEGDEEEEGDIVPVTQSIEYVNVAGTEPSVVYTYGANNRVMYYD